VDPAISMKPILGQTPTAPEHQLTATLRDELDTLT
jgi:hypothetical protein